MSLSYLQPVDEAFTLDDYKPQQVGFQLHKHLPSLGLPDLTDVKIAFSVSKQKNSHSIASVSICILSLWEIGILPLPIWVTCP